MEDRGAGQAEVLLMQPQAAWMKSLRDRIIDLHKCGLRSYIILNLKLK